LKCVGLTVLLGLRVPVFADGLP